jgi:hypothetical protein
MRESALSLRIRHRRTVSHGLSPVYIILPSPLPYNLLWSYPQHLSSSFFLLPLTLIAPLFSANTSNTFNTYNTPSISHLFSLARTRTLKPIRCAKDLCSAFFSLPPARRLHHSQAFCSQPLSLIFTLLPLRQIHSTYSLAHVKDLAHHLLTAHILVEDGTVQHDERLRQRP